LAPDAECCYDESHCTNHHYIERHGAL